MKGAINNVENENLVHMVKFLLFSMSAGIIQAISFALFFEITKLEYWSAYIIALALSIVWNFTLNRKFTFKSSANVPVAMTKIAIYYAVFTPLSTWWGDVLTNLGWMPYLVLFLTMVVNLVTEFIVTKYVVFKDEINTAIVK
ncbi:MAG: GtrA family protein [Flavobacteriales bacterium]|nr:GtrA family protein [Flavobacteriales bacterium]